MQPLPILGTVVPMVAILQYQKVKDHILDGLKEGTWRTGDKIPSESELVQTCSASRMTVNRAVRELADLGLLERVPGAGTFVANEREASQFLEVRDIAVQIRENNQRHSAEVIMLETVMATAELAAEFENQALADLFHSIILHKADGVPVQLENRYVNPDSDPGYLQADFSQTTPTERLIAMAPLAEVEHMVEAVMPSAAERDLLKLDETTPCLRLTRRTWSGPHVATYVRLLYPGQRFRIGTRFSYCTGDSQKRSAARRAASQNDVKGI
ncbi:MAG: histidine utilization repressor [Rhodospirillaceae bacterium TMED167]|nr:histidine utilization repressor [Rhodospirillaceae bacterium]OUW30182.1 MAG: histidine utilization repressor [Rhodospirillaceae bacterium TMED167]